MTWVGIHNILVSEIVLRGCTQEQEIGRFLILIRNLNLYLVFLLHGDFKFDDSFHLMVVIYMIIVTSWYFPYNMFSSNLIENMRVVFICEQCILLLFEKSLKKFMLSLNIHKMIPWQFSYFSDWIWLLLFLFSMKLCKEVGIIHKKHLNSSSILRDMG
jgi:CDP-diglyceride synthetase